MANINRYVYNSLITLNGNQAHIYKDDAGVLYTVMHMSRDDSQWIDIFFSIDDGLTWNTDSALPINEFPLYNPKFTIVDGVWYIFASGTTFRGNSGIYYIRRYRNPNSTEQWVWDSNWRLAIPTNARNHRLTDLCVDDNGSFIHLIYDELNTYQKYQVKYAAFSATDYEVKYTANVYPQSNLNQHNGRLMILASSVLALSWEQENAAGVAEIYYRQFDYLTQEFADAIRVSEETSNNCYHQSFCLDSDYTVHLTWLNTPTTIHSEDGNIFYYEKSHVQYTRIVNMKQKDIETLSVEAKDNQYPYILTDANDSLYILYNIDGNSLQYFARAVGETEWNAIENVQANNWKLVCGYSEDDNLYTISVDDDKAYFTRIDTRINDNIIPVQDLQVADISNTQIHLAWSQARNAEEIYVEEIAEDTWISLDNDAFVSEMRSSTEHAQVLMGAGKYKFRVRYAIDEVYDYLTIDGVFEQDEEQNIILDWILPDGATDRTLQYAKETWKQIAEVTPSLDNIVVDFDGRITWFRLNIVGGAAEGYSNHVRPLTIELNEENNVVLEWSKPANAVYIDIQQSIDGEVWYPAKPDNAITLDDETAIISNLNAVEYRYRLRWVTNEAYKYSNIAVFNNTLKVISNEWNSVTLHWTSVDDYELYMFQYSIDNGMTWTDTTNPVRANVVTIPGLKYDTNYLIRIHYLERYTGVYSNVIAVHTNKKPVQDLRAIELKPEFQQGIFQFYIDEPFSDIDIHIVDVIAETQEVKKLSEVPYEVYAPKEDYPDQKTITFTLNGLKKGTYFALMVEPLDSKYGDLSNIVEFNTTGDNPQNLAATEISAHGAKITWDTLDRIDENTYDFVIVKYSYDNANWMEATGTNTSCTLDKLMQDTTYYVKLTCLYGDNYGDSDTITFRTATDSFAPVYGNRLPGERSFTKIGDIFWVFDSGNLYRIQGDTQELVVSYPIKASHIYSDIASDKNGCIHLVFSCGKNIYYATNCKEAVNAEEIIQHNIEDAMVIKHSVIVNEFMHAQIKINQFNNVAMISWEENNGNFSNACAVWYRNGSKFVDEKTLIIDGQFNHAPRIAVWNSGDWYLAAISNDHITIVKNVVEADYTKDTYLQDMTTTTTVDITDAYADYFNNFDISVDNLGGLRISYDSVTNNEKTVTYGTFIDDEYKLVNIFGQQMKDTKVIAETAMVIIGLSDTDVYTSKYLQPRETFTDMMRLSEVSIEDENPFCVYHNDKDIYMLSFEAGKFKIQEYAIKDIADGNNYVGSVWLDNQFSLQNDQEDYVVNVWTVGNPSYYPAVYIKVNDITKEITPLDEYGYRAEEKIAIGSFEPLDITSEEVIANGYVKDNTISLVQITYNTDKNIVVDLTNMMYYTWDNTTIINSAS